MQNVLTTFISHVKLFKSASPKRVAFNITLWVVGIFDTSFEATKTNNMEYLRIPIIWYTNNMVYHIISNLRILDRSKLSSLKTDITRALPTMAYKCEAYLFQWQPGSIQTHNLTSYCVWLFCPEEQMDNIPSLGSTLVHHHSSSLNVRNPNRNNSQNIHELQDIFHGGNLVLVVSLPVN